MLRPGFSAGCTICALPCPAPRGPCQVCTGYVGLNVPCLFMKQGVCLRPPGSGISLLSAPAGWMLQAIEGEWALTLNATPWAARGLVITARLLKCRSKLHRDAADLLHPSKLR